MFESASFELPFVPARASSRVAAMNFETSYLGRRVEAQVLNKRKSNLGSRFCSRCVVGQRVGHVRQKVGHNDKKKVTNLCVSLFVSLFSSIKGVHVQFSRPRAFEAV